MPKPQKASTDTIVFWVVVSLSAGIFLYLLGYSDGMADANGVCRITCETPSK